MRFRFLLLASALFVLLCVQAGAQSVAPGLGTRIPAERFGGAPQDGYIPPPTQKFPPPLIQNSAVPGMAGSVKAPMLSQSEGLCYAMRTYRYKREQPGSDVMSRAGSSTCAPANGVRERSAGASVGSRPSEPPRVVVPIGVTGVPTRR